MENDDGIGEVEEAVNEEPSLEDKIMQEALNGADDDGTETGDEEDELTEFDEAEGDTPEVLKTKLAAKSKILNQRDKAIKRMKKELAGFTNSGGLSKEDLAEVLAASRQGEEVKETAIVEPFSFEGIQEKIDSGETSITQVLKSMQEAQAGKDAQREQMFVDILKQRDAYLENKDAESEMENLDPTVKKVAEAFKASGQYGGFNDAQLVQLAKLKVTTAGNKIKRFPAKVTSGSAGGIKPKVVDAEAVKQGHLKTLGYPTINN